MNEARARPAASQSCGRAIIRNAQQRVQVRLTAAGEKCLARLAEQHRVELKSLAHVFQVANISAFNDRA